MLFKLKKKKKKKVGEKKIFILAIFSRGKCATLEYPDNKIPDLKKKKITL
jgi:hypothetical protein